MLYVMRHGLTDWNVEHRLQGRTDIPLNEEGRRMAREAAELYKDTHFDICFCSPLVRARETAEILLKDRDVPIVVDERLAEMGFGTYEGEKDVFEKPDCPVLTLFRAPQDYTVAVEGGETLDDLCNRTGEFLEEKALPLVEEGKDVLILGHGAMNSSIISKIRGFKREDFWKVGIQNCRLIRLI